LVFDRFFFNYDVYVGQAIPIGVSYYSYATELLVAGLCIKIYDLTFHIRKRTEKMRLPHERGDSEVYVVMQKKVISTAQKPSKSTLSVRTVFAKRCGPKIEIESY
jgi:hypothetical protein